MISNKTKIVATLGPACSTRRIKKDMIDAVSMCLELIFLMPIMLMSKKNENH
jgi:pyruvate kinase